MVRPFSTGPSRDQYTNQRRKRRLTSESDEVALGARASAAFASLLLLCSPPLRPRAQQRVSSFRHEHFYFFSFSFVLAWFCPYLPVQVWTRTPVRTGISNLLGTHCIRSILQRTIFYGLIPYLRSFST